MKPIVTIILAAGKGTRMKSERPKVLHKVCGRPIIHYVLDIAEAAGSLKTIAVLGYKSEEVKAQLPKGCLTVIQKKLLGTADAVRSALPGLGGFRGDILILSGDTPLLDKTVLRALIARHRKTKAACTFLTSVVPDPYGYGRIIRDDKGMAVAIREDKDATGLQKEIAEINVGLYCIDAFELEQGLKQVKLNKKKKEFYLTDLIEYLSQQGKKVQTIETKECEEGLGINTREDLAFAEGVIRKRNLKYFMSQGVTIADPSTTYIERSVKIGQDTIIRPFTFIEGDVSVGKNCVIGPFARLRAGTKIKDGVEIGNFTEVSRSKVGRKTLMKHFSFLGDALVGDNVNIGAGTITANFDGVNKNITHIGSGAFIGSDTVLIAPVKIGKKAVVGAGSVVPRGKNIPDGRVAYGVPAKIIVKNA
ncbi:MAG: NTP transferase domain-containing protein [Candidatus Omnitrophica bacterium]|nr:NTP transferase domain-containing protein [Candidatus Omnitrophota bacterium]